MNFMKEIIETTGYTIKEETVDLLTHHILANTFVINVNHPFPGFYGTPVIEETKPKAILLVTKEKYSWEKILRTSASINKFTHFNIDSTYARIQIGNTYLDSIRIKGIESYDDIPVIQHAFQEEGFTFMNSKKIKENQTISIKLSKFYLIDQLEEDIYKDMSTDNMHYIIIPHNLNWELFRTITLNIKNNISNRNYDVVQGIFFKDRTVRDMIRVYKPDITIELLREIRERYKKEIDRYF